MAKILLVNGPNLNLLGQRQPELYGATSLKEIEASLHALAGELGHELVSVQSNSEAALIEAVHEAGRRGIAYVLINPAAFTHSSIALRDALLAVGIPFIEIHLSNVHAREPFRRRSYFSDAAVGCIVGLGAIGYELALRAAAEHLTGTGTPASSA